MGHGTM